MVENDDKDVLVKLAKVEQQLQNSNENHQKTIDVQNKIFEKIDRNEKGTFELKSKHDTLVQTTEIKITEINKDIDDAKDIAKENKTTFTTFKNTEFKPISNAIQKAKGALFVVKVVYPIIFIILQIIGVAVAIHYGGK